MPSPAVLESYNPATGEKLGAAPVCSAGEVCQAVAAARAAQRPWGMLTVRARIRALRPLQRLLVAQRDALVVLSVAEQGKDQMIAYSEIFSALRLLNYFFRVAPRLLRTRPAFPLVGLLHVNRIVLQPHGVVGVIAPWTYPVSLMLEPTFAALIAGNAVVIKPSEQTPLLGLKLGALFHEAGLPADLVQVVTGGAATGAALIAGGIDKLVFIGSTPNGRKAAALAGHHLVPLTLELGGKDAALVLADADLERAAAGIVWGANLNAGQTCLSIERVYVVEEIAQPFIERLVAQVQQLRVGPGTDPTTDIPPITTEAQLAVIQSQIDDAVARGAHVLCGGRRADRPGRFFEPTVVVDVTDEMRVMREETFGPVIAVQRVRNAEEAVRRANASPFGLTASIWTRNLALGQRLAAQIEAGDVAVNDHGTPTSHPEIPWGGVKASGYGRTRGKAGLLEMVTLKHLSWPRFQTRREPFWFPNSAQTIATVRQAIPLLFGTWRERVAALRGFLSRS